jgi:ribosome-associated protein
MQFIGKLMRQLEAAKLDEIRNALDEQHTPSARETLALHLAEQWRDRLIAQDEAVADWIKQFPQTDTQQLRALVRQARKDAPVQNAVTESKGLAPRKGRAYRDIFLIVKELLSETEENHE